MARVGEVVAGVPLGVGGGGEEGGLALAGSFPRSSVADLAHDSHDAAWGVADRVLWCPLGSYPCSLELLFYSVCYSSSRLGKLGVAHLFCCAAWLSRALAPAKQCCSAQERGERLTLARRCARGRRGPGTLAALRSHSTLQTHLHLLNVERGAHRGRTGRTFIPASAVTALTVPLAPNALTHSLHHMCGC